MAQRQPHDAQQLPLWQNFQSAPHSHESLEKPRVAHNLKLSLQVEKAYEYLLAHCKTQECKTDFTISCPGGMRGIYLREPHKLDKPSEVAVTVEPVHFENDISKYLESVHRHPSLLSGMLHCSVSCPACISGISHSRTYENDVSLM